MVSELFVRPTAVLSSAVYTWEKVVGDTFSFFALWKISPSWNFSKNVESTLAWCAYFFLTQVKVSSDERSVTRSFYVNVTVILPFQEIVVMSSAEYLHI